MSEIRSAVALRNRLKVRQLNLLAALGESPSLHKAAEALGMSQPAATRLLQELEEMFCCALFERTNRGLVPTETGRMLVKHASGFVEGIDRIFEDAHSLRAGSAGTLRIGISTNARPDLAPRAAMALRQRHPQLAIYLQDGAQAELLAALKRGALSAVVGRAPALDRQAPLHFEPLYDESFVVVAGVTNPCPAQDAEGVLANLVDTPWILPAPDTALRRTFENQFVGACGRTPAEFIESVAVTSTLAILEHGQHVALLPKAVANYFAERRLLKILTPEMPHLSGTVGVSMMPDSQGSMAMERFLKAIREVL